MSYESDGKWCQLLQGLKEKDHFCNSYVFGILGIMLEVAIMQASRRNGT